MGIKTNCTCDICGKEMHTPEDYKSSCRAINIVIFSQYYPFVCNECRRKIEQFIVDLSKPSYGVSVRPSLFDWKSDYKLQDEMKALYIFNGRDIIKVIQAIRARTSLWLTDAKDIAEHWRRLYHWDDPKATWWPTNPGAEPKISDLIEQYRTDWSAIIHQVKYEYLYHDYPKSGWREPGTVKPNKIQAIVKLRALTNLGLKEAKEMVEYWIKLYEWDKI